MLDARLGSIALLWTPASTSVMCASAFAEAWFVAICSRIADTSAATSRAFVAPA